MGNMAIGDVSRETLEKLTIFEDLLRKWSQKINLVAPSTLSTIWNRHIADSLQLVDLMREQTGRCADLGSGGGLPGLITAIARNDRAPKISDVYLLESDQRKCAFLRAVLRETDTPATVVAQRIEHAEPLNCDLITARALAPLPRLLDYALRHANTGGTCFFQKGQTWKEEAKAAEESFSFSCKQHNSRTQDGSVILEIGEISRV